MDSYGMYGKLPLFPAAKHKPGEMRHVVDADHNHYMGEIEEAPETYQVIGQINEHQLSITETTFTGRKELCEPNGIIDYVSLMTIGLQRARTAREAIKVMTELVDRYGYASSGETFSIADPNEIWIMEMIGKGAGEKGAVWVAIRIPDDCICAHANQSRIHQFDQKDKKNVIYSTARMPTSVSPMPIRPLISTCSEHVKRVSGVSSICMSMAWSAISIMPMVAMWAPPR